MAQIGSVSADGLKDLSWGFLWSFMICLFVIVLHLLTVLCCWVGWSVYREYRDAPRGSLLPHIIRDQATLKHVLSVTSEYFEDELRYYPVDAEKA